MTPTAWLIVFFFILLALSILVYVLVVRAFYWGDKKERRLRSVDQFTKSLFVVDRRFDHYDIAGNFKLQIF